MRILFSLTLAFILFSALEEKGMANFSTHFAPAKYIRSVLLTRMSNVGGGWLEAEVQSNSTTIKFAVCPSNKLLVSGLNSFLNNPRPLDLIASTENIIVGFVFSGQPYGVLSQHDCQPSTDTSFKMVLDLNSHIAAVQTVSGVTHFKYLMANATRELSFPWNEASYKTDLYLSDAQKENQPLGLIRGANNQFFGMIYPEGTNYTQAWINF